MICLFLLDQSSSAPIARDTEQIVATQPPKSSSNLSTPSKSSLSLPSNEESICHLENKNSSLLPQDVLLRSPSSTAIHPNSAIVNISQSFHDEIDIDDWNWSSQVFSEDLSSSSG